MDTQTSRGLIVVGLAILGSLAVITLALAKAAPLPFIASEARWPASLEAFHPCIVNRTLPSILDDASGLSWDPSGTWWLVSNKPLAAVKYDITFSRVLQSVSLDRVHDPEAIAWVDPGRLAVAEEMRDVVLVELAGPEMVYPRSTSRISLSALVRTPNKGVEGIAYDTVSGDFLLAQEDFPKAVYRLSFDGSYKVLFYGDVLDVKDFSDLACWGPNCSQLLILSQSSKRVLHTDLHGNLISTFKVKGLPRPEGIALSGDGRLMAIASEPNTFNLYSTELC